MMIVHTVAGTTQAPGGTYAYVLTGESYVYEQAITISSMSNKYGVAMEYAQGFLITRKSWF